MTKMNYANADRATRSPGQNALLEGEQEREDEELDEEEHETWEREEEEQEAEDEDLEEEEQEMEYDRGLNLMLGIGDIPQTVSLGGSLLSMQSAASRPKRLFPFRDHGGKQSGSDFLMLF